MEQHTFLPVLLGSDINAYGMARSFHEEYGVKSLALASFPLAPTRYSKIVTVQVHKSLADPEAFLAIVLEQGKELSTKHDKLVLVPCGHTALPTRPHASLLPRTREMLMPLRFRLVSLLLSSRQIRCPILT